MNVLQEKNACNSFAKMGQDNQLSAHRFSRAQTGAVAVALAFAWGSASRNGQLNEAIRIRWWA